MSLDRVPGADVLVTRDRRGWRLRAKIGLTLAVVALTIVLGRNVLATLAVRASVRSIAGMPVEIRRLDMRIVAQRLRISGLRVFSPSEFHGEMFADIPEVDVTYNFPALLQGRLHVRRAALRIDRIGIVRNERGQTNLQYLQRWVTPPKPGGESLRREPEGFLIDRLELSIGEVMFYDYAKGTPPQVTEFAIGIEGEPFERITDRRMIVGLLMLKAMSKSALGRVPDLDVDLGAVERSVRQSMKSGLGLMK